MIDPEATWIDDVSPVEPRVLVIRHGSGQYPFFGDLAVATNAGAITTVTTEPMLWATFSSDGRSILAASPDGLFLARADGTGFRRVTANSAWYPAGRRLGHWLYFSEGNTLYRLSPPDGVAAPVATLDGNYAATLLDISPDTEMALFCGNAPFAPSFSWNCQLVPAGNSAAFQLPDEDISWAFSPDSRWLVKGCRLFDRSGGSRMICDPALGRNEAIFSADGARLAVSTGSGTRVIDLASGEETALPGRFYAGSSFTPDGSRIVGRVGENAFSVAAVRRPSWIELSSDVFYERGFPDVPGGASTSPDSRIVATTSISSGVVESIDGGPARVLSHSGMPLYHATPIFEPAGGFGKAIFYQTEGSGMRPAIANADGTGEWIALPRTSAGLFPRWAGHSVLSWVPNSATGGDFFVITGDGQQAGILASNTAGPVQYAPVFSSMVAGMVGGSIDQPVLYYLRPGGGLLAVAVPQPAH